MEEINEFRNKTKEELKQLAQGLEIPKISAMKKDELVNAIIQKRKENAEISEKEPSPKKQRPKDVIEVCGILDVMADGFGFLRLENYRPGSDDIYVSPTQIRRFNLKTGDEIRGDARPSQDEDKYSPLLYVKKINGDPLEIALKRKNFERLTPIYPKEKLCLETGDKSKYASRIID